MNNQLLFSSTGKEVAHCIAQRRKKEQGDPSLSLSLPLSYHPEHTFKEDYYTLPSPISHEHKKNCT